MKKNLIIPVCGLMLAFMACKRAPLPPENLNAVSNNTEQNTLNGLAATYTPSLDESSNILLNASGYNPKFDGVQEPWGQTAPRNYQLGLVDSKANMTRYPGGTWGSYFDYNNETLFPKKSSADPNGWVNTTKIHNEGIGERIENGLQKVNSIADLKYAAKGGLSGQSVNVVFQMNMITPGWDFYKTIHPGWAAPNPGSANLNDTWYKMLDDRYNRFKAMLIRAKTGPDPIAIRFIELGNEYYFGDPYQVEAFRGGGDYGKAANYIANKLKNDAALNLPANVRIAATASYVSGGTRAQEWNMKLKAELNRDLVPYITLHVYKVFEEPANYNETSFQTKVVSWYQAVNQGFVSSNADAAFVAPSSGQPWKVWYTEMNANWSGALDPEDLIPVDQRTWAQSLIEAYSAQHLYDRGNAAMYLQFQFNNQVRKNADIIGGVRLYNRALALMPFMEASKDATSAARVSFTGTGIPTLPSSPKAVVAGYAFTTAAGIKKCFFINLSATSKQLNLGANIFTGGSSNVHVKSYNNTDISTIAMPALTNTTQAKTNVTLPPYSVSYIYQ